MIKRVLISGKWRTVAVSDQDFVDALRECLGLAPLYRAEVVVFELPIVSIPYCNATGAGIDGMTSKGRIPT